MIITTLVLYSCKKEIADPEMFTQSEYETALSFLENANPPNCLLYTSDAADE